MSKAALHMVTKLEDRSRVTFQNRIRALRCGMLLLVILIAGCIDFDIPALDVNDSETLHPEDTNLPKDTNTNTGDTASIQDTTTNTDTALSTDSDSAFCGDTCSDTHVDSATDSVIDTATQTDSESSTDSSTDTAMDTATSSDLPPDSETDSSTDTDLYTLFDTAAFSGGYDSRPVVEPVLFDFGGAGNVTASAGTNNPSASTGAACNYGETSIYSYAAINVNHASHDGMGQWNQGKICGECARVSIQTSTGMLSTVVRIMERCADDLCGIDLGGQPAQQLMGALPGKYLGYWTFVPCSEGVDVSDGPASIFVKEGSSAWWSLIQIRNAPASVESIDWQTASGFSGTLEFATEAENFWVVPVQVRQTSEAVTLTLRFNFDITIVHSLPGTDLTVGGSLVELPAPTQ